jgi:hypothetical protein
MLPLATTTVTVERPAVQDGDPDDDWFDQAPTVIAAGMACTITSPSGDDSVVAGHKEVVDAVLHAPPTPLLTHLDLVVDDTSGDRWRIVWVRRRQGLGLDHQVAGLRAVTGGASA